MNKGYDVKIGYVGILPDGSKMIFPTENEYLEYINELNEEDSQ